MAEYAEGQEVKGKFRPKECPLGFYWRKTTGEDEFKLYPKKERKTSGTALTHVEDDGPKLTARRVAAGIRFYMQNEDGFKRVMAEADLSAKSLQNLSQWTNAMAAVKAEKEKIRTSAVSKANSALKDAGLMIAPDGTVQLIPTA